MGKREFRRVANTPPAPAPVPPQRPSAFDIRVVQRRFVVMQEQIARMAVEASQFIAERDLWREEALALKRELEQLKGGK